MNNPDLLREQYTIDTPENVTFGYDIAGIGSRFIGCLIDTLLILLLLLILNGVVGLLLANLADGAAGGATGLASDDGSDPGWLAGLLIALYALVNFALIWGYYLAFELRWNGQTPGKRAAGTQVVKTDGAPAGFSEAAIRNLVRIVDFLPAAYAIGFITMFFNRQTRRLGDFAAGTLVIKQRQEVKLAHLASAYPAAAVPGGAPTPGAAADARAAVLLRFPHLRQLTATDYQLVREVLARHDRGTAGPEVLHRVALAIATKLGEPAPPRDWVACRKLLVEVTEGYRALG